MGLRPIYGIVVSLFMSLLILLSVTGCSGDKNKKLPSEISAQVWDSMMTLLSGNKIASRDDYYLARRKYTRALIDSMRTKNLEMDEKIECAEIFANAGYVEKAEKLLKPIIRDDNKNAESALKSLIMIEIQNEKVDEAEKLMDDFHRRFPPDGSNPRYLFSHIMELVDLLIHRDRPNDAERVIMKELKSLNFDAPYFSYYYVSELVPILVEKDSLEGFDAFVDSLRNGLAESYKAYMDTVSYTDSTEAAKDETRKNYKSMIEVLENVMKEIEIIGTKAPEIEFAHVYNADSNVTFQGLLGKVTILDFWTTTCVPCIVGFGELRELYKG